MFEKKEEQPIVSKPPTLSQEDDMVIHVMPKQFYGKEVAKPEVEKPAPISPPVHPIPEPAAPVMKPVTPHSPPPVPPPPRRTKMRVIMVLFVFLVLLGCAATVGYYFYLLPTLTPSQNTTPSSTQTPTPEPAPEPVPEPAPKPVPVPGVDTDSDGLTDVEELLYGTDYRDPDTDKDTFLDGNEVFHRYDPNGNAPQTLLDTGAVRVFQNTELPFTVFYPSPWTPVVSASAPLVTFRSPSTASVRVTWAEKDSGMSLEDWFNNSIEDGDLNTLEPTYTKEGLYALSNHDERVAYVDGGGRVYTFTYDLGDELTIEYLQTFQMMVNSFHLLP